MEANIKYRMAIGQQLHLFWDYRFLDTPGRYNVSEHEESFLNGVDV